jgi:hypothetical protein
VAYPAYPSPASAPASKLSPGSDHVYQPRPLAVFLDHVLVIVAVELLGSRQHGDDIGGADAAANDADRFYFDASNLGEAMITGFNGAGAYSDDRLTR